MKEKDKFRFFDTSSLCVTPGIHDRCHNDYLQAELQKRFPDEIFRVISVTVNETGNYKSKISWILQLLWAKADMSGLPAYCEVEIQHKTGTEQENIIVWCPLAWNDRFAGTAGGGTCTGGRSQMTAPNNAIRGWTVPYALMNGFTAATTDGGNTIHGNNWALDKDTGKIVWDRVENWRARSTHNMTIFGKAVAEILHQRSVKYAYMNGGSGGGRQSMVEAQEYPDDYDGIWANCPAINWNKFLMVAFWPIAVMHSYGKPLHYEKLNYFAKAVHESVGGREAYYKLNHRVGFDPFTLVGQKTKAGIITETDAAIMKEIWDGPHRKNGERLWFGFRPGLMNWRRVLPLGFIVYPLFSKWPKPFFLVEYWARWITENPKQRFRCINMENFEELFDKSVAFGKMPGDDADLRPFAAKGGKLMIDHGLDDPLIPVEGTMEYYSRICEIMGKKQVDQFCRLYLTPGDNHGNCHGNGPGITEADGIRALMDWVEKGIAPEALRVVQINQKTGETICERTHAPE